MKHFKHLLLLLAATAAVQAPAEYLLWSLDWDEVDESADYAALVVLDPAGQNINGAGSTTYTYLLLADTPSPGETFLYKGPDSPVEATSVVDPYNSGNYSFAIQLYDSGDKLVAQSETASYADLGGSIWKNDFNPGVTTVWSPSNYSAVPEPATGALFLAGALMLFRRRRE